MIDATRRNPPKRRDSIVVEICETEDLTVIENAPGFPSDEELVQMGFNPATGEPFRQSEEFGNSAS